MDNIHNIYMGFIGGIFSIKNGLLFLYNSTICKVVYVITYFHHILFSKIVAIILKLNDLTKCTLNIQIQSLRRYVLVFHKKSFTCITGCNPLFKTSILQFFMLIFQLPKTQNFTPLFFIPMFDVSLLLRQKKNMNTLNYAWIS